MRVVPRTAVITGAPGAGKTALIKVLAARGWRTVPETARALLTSPGGMALRSSDPAGFAAAMLERELADLEAASDGDGWTIFDRGVGDSLGFLRLLGLNPPDALMRRVGSLHYSGPVFTAPAWAEIYCPDNERIQTWEEAMASGAAVESAWRDAGYQLIELPRASIEQRADFVAERLRQ